MKTLTPRGTARCIADCIAVNYVSDEGTASAIAILAGELGEAAMHAHFVAYADGSGHLERDSDWVGELAAHLEDIACKMKKQVNS